MKFFILYVSHISNIIVQKRNLKSVYRHGVGIRLNAIVYSQTKEATPHSSLCDYCVSFPTLHYGLIVRATAWTLPVPDAYT